MTRRPLWTLIAWGLAWIVLGAVVWLFAPVI